MSWKNLIDNKCPSCGSHIFADDPGVNCSNVHCNFFITKNRLEEIKADLSRDKIKSEEMEGFGFD